MEARKPPSRFVGPLLELHARKSVPREHSGDRTICRCPGLPGGVRAWRGEISSGHDTGGTTGVGGRETGV